MPGCEISLCDFWKYGTEFLDFMENVKILEHIRYHLDPQEEIL
jgi:hypothetical protein